MLRCKPVIQDHRSQKGRQALDRNALHIFPNREGEAGKEGGVTS